MTRVLPAPHTPGPWIIQRSRTIRPNYALICGQDWHDLANVVVRYSGDKEDDATGLANARLIAAAPETIKALEALLEMYVKLANSGDTGTRWDPEDEPEVHAARRAIDKAKGE